MLSFTDMKVSAENLTKSQGVMVIRASHLAICVKYLSRES